MLPLIPILSACFAGSALLMAVLNHLASSKWRHSGDLHWAERARLLHPVRFGAAMNVFYLAGLCALIGFLDEETRTRWPWFAVAGLLGALLGCFPLDRQIMPELNFRNWLAQVSLSWGTRVLLFGPLILAMVLMPPFWDWQVLWVAIPFTVWHLWYATGGLIQLCRWTRILKHLPQSESAMLDDCFAKLQIRPRAILVLSSPFALAYAFPFRKELVFTRGFLDKCAPEEMKVICLHELAHLNEDWAMLTRRLLVSFIFYPFIFVRPAIHTWELPGLLLIYALFILLLILARRVGRKGELRADQVAATHELDAGLYARALERIYMLNQIPAVTRGKRHIHPHLYDRMIASGVTPDFPRPKPPGFLNWTILIPMIGLLIFAMYFYVRVGMN